jgi:uncharacterized membrane protein HdeD (DUF308 family)
MSEERHQRPKSPGLWKLVLGLILVVGSIRAWIAANPNIPTYLQYSNDTQRFAGIAAQVVIFLLGTWLIGDWAHRIWQQRRQKPVPAEKQPG